MKAFKLAVRKIQLSYTDELMFSYLKTTVDLPGGVNLKADVLPLRRCDYASHQWLKQLLQISSAIHLHK